MVLNVKVQIQLGRQKQDRSRLFMLICLLLGFDMRDKTKRWSSCAVFTFYLTTLVLSIYPTVLIIKEHYVSQPSLVNFAQLGQMLSSYVVMVLAAQIIVFKRTELSNLLKGASGQSWKQITCLVILIVPGFIIYNVLIITICHWKSFAASFSLILFAHRIHVRNLLNVIYIEATSVLETRCKSLLELSSTQRLRPQLLANEKWLIQKSIMQLNALFAVPIAVVYLQITLDSILLTGTIATKITESAGLAVMFMHICFLVTVYVMAWRSSRLMSSLQKLEYRLLQRLSEAEAYDDEMLMEKINADQCCPSVQLKMICFDDNWDTPRVGCFVHSQKTFFKFCATLVTFLAIVMQFDYRIMRVINDLAHKYGRDAIFKWH